VAKVDLKTEISRSILLIP
jgi:hypothetical protein